jgi:hypothetical protein
MIGAGYRQVPQQIGIDPMLRVWPQISPELFTDDELACNFLTGLGPATVICQWINRVSVDVSSGFATMRSSELNTPRDSIGV